MQSQTAFSVSSHAQLKKNYFVEARNVSHTLRFLLFLLFLIEHGVKSVLNNDILFEFIILCSFYQYIKSSENWFI